MAFYFFSALIIIFFTLHLRLLKSLAMKDEALLLTEIAAGSEPDFMCVLFCHRSITF